MLSFRMRAEKANFRLTFIIHEPVAVQVRFPDHVLHLLVGQLLAQVRHHVAQLRGTDEAVAVSVEDAKCLPQLLFLVRLLHLLRHHMQELVKFDRAVACMHKSVKNRNQTPFHFLFFTSSFALFAYVFSRSTLLA